MPTFDLECKVCGFVFESFLNNYKDSDFMNCSKCGGKLKRRIGKPMVIFKGFGFYATEHQNKHFTNGRLGWQKDKSQGSGDLARALTKKHPETPVVPTAFINN